MSIISAFLDQPQNTTHQEWTSCLLTYYDGECDYFALTGLTHHKADALTLRAIREPGSVPLQFLVDVLSSHEGRRYVLRLLDVILPLIHLPTDDHPLANYRLQKDTLRHWDNFILGLVALNHILWHAECEEELLPTISPPILFRIDEILSCIDAGLTWALKSPDDNLSYHQNARPSRFPLVLAHLVRRFTILSDDNFSLFAPKPGFTRVVIRLWLLKNVNGETRIHDGDPDDYVVYSPHDDEEWDPFIGILRRLLGSEDDYFWERWLSHCLSIQLDPVPVLVESLISRLRTFRKYCKRVKPDEDGELDLSGHWLELQELELIAFNLRISVSVADEDAFAALDAQFFEQGFVLELVKALYILSEKTFDGEAARSLNEDIARTGLSHLGNWFADIIRPEDRPESTLSHHLAMVKAGLLPFLVNALCRLPHGTRLGEPNELEESDGLASKDDDYSDSEDGGEEIYAAECMLYAVFCFTAHPPILSAVHQSLDCIPVWRWAVASETILSIHPSWPYEGGLDRFRDKVDAWHSYLGVYRKALVALCDNPGHTFATTSSRPSKQCSGCRAVVYCSSACQRRHWDSGHKQECKANLVYRAEREHDQSWYSHHLRAWHFFLIETIYKNEAYGQEHSDANFVCRIAADSPTHGVYFKPLDEYEHREVLDDPSKEQRLAEMINKVLYQGGSANKNNGTLRLIEGLFWFGYRLLCVTILVERVPSDQGVEIRTLESVARIGRCQLD